MLSKVYTHTDDDVWDTLLELGKVSSDGDSCDDQTGCERRAPAGVGPLG